MFCTGCGTQAPVMGQFCSNCDHRARVGTLERRRAIGGSQWQALWGISYADDANKTSRRRWMQCGGVLVMVLMIAMLQF
jgi:hypothetical protein